jgi:hypothetical protein
MAREEISRLANGIYRESSLKDISLSSVLIVVLLLSKARQHRANSLKL